MAAGDVSLSRALSPEDVEAIAAFAMMEMLESGFTALAEFHYLHHDRRRPCSMPIPRNSRSGSRPRRLETGMGLTLLPVFYANGGFGGTAPQEGQRRFLSDVAGYLRLVEGARKSVAETTTRSSESLRIACAPSRRRSLEEVVGNCLGLSGPYPRGGAGKGSRGMRHLVGSAPGRVASRTCAGRPASWCLIHATHLDPRLRRALLRRRGAVAGLCPITEANLGDGIFEGVAYLSQGGRFGVGSDSNIELTAPGELKQFEYSQRLKWRARNLLALREGQSTGHALYEGALAGGAQAVGRRVGAIAAGCRADIVVLDAAHPDLAASSPDDWISIYIFTAGGGAIDSVFVGGGRVVTEGRHYRRDAIAARYARTMARILA